VRAARAGAGWCLNGVCLARTQAARAVREQHLEALELNYRSERRDAIRSLTQAHAARRRELETSAGQALARLLSSEASTSASAGAGAGGAARSGPAPRSGSAPARNRGPRQRSGGGADAARGEGVDEVTARSAGRPAGGSGVRADGTARPSTLLEELKATLNTGVRAHAGASIAGHGAIRFG
jgi:hypothetical protein